MSQSKEILKHLQSGRSITSIEAINMFGCTRLASRILELRKDHDIDSESVTKGGKTFASYSLRNVVREPVWASKDFILVEDELEGQQTLDL